MTHAASPVCVPLIFLLGDKISAFAYSFYHTLVNQALSLIFSIALYSVVAYRIIMLRLTYMSYVVEMDSSFFMHVQHKKKLTPHLSTRKKSLYAGRISFDFGFKRN